jgi:hypothetical protein
VSQNPLDWVIAAVVGWLAVGAVGLVRPRRLAFVSHVLFPIGAAIGLALVVAVAAIGREAQTAVPSGLPTCRSTAARRALGVLPAAGRHQRRDLLYAAGVPARKARRRA